MWSERLEKNLVPIHLSQARPTNSGREASMADRPVAGAPGGNSTPVSDSNVGIDTPPSSPVLT